MWSHDFEHDDTVEPFRKAWKGVFLAAGGFDRVRNPYPVRT
jgi:hypothetical protein